jgi:hypothetical protein
MNQTHNLNSWYRMKNIIIYSIFIIIRYITSSSHFTFNEGYWKRATCYCEKSTCNDITLLFSWSCAKNYFNLSLLLHVFYTYLEGRLVYTSALAEKQVHLTFRLLFQFRMVIPHPRRDIRPLRNSQAARRREMESMWVMRD